MAYERFQTSTFEIMAGVWSDFVRSFQMKLRNGVSLKSVHHIMICIENVTSVTRKSTRIF